MSQDINFSIWAHRICLLMYMNVCIIFIIHPFVLNTRNINQKFIQLYIILNIIKFSYLIM